MPKARRQTKKRPRKARARAPSKASKVRGLTKGFVVHVPDKVDVRAIRRKLSLTRVAFAHRFGFSLAAVKEWEIGRRSPDRSARVLLKVIAHEPEAVARALAPRGHGAANERSLGAGSRRELLQAVQALVGRGII
jgi:putative transcriptional regulator